MKPQERIDAGQCPLCLEPITQGGHETVKIDGAADVIGCPHMPEGLVISIENIPNFVTTGEFVAELEAHRVGE